MSDYKKSLNLPDTSFPMKANLTQREPEMLRWWEENNIYGTMLEASGSRGSFRLHDGPPYANGHLHLGHALNKILKDITIKSRNIQGQQSMYVPGWDCHGLPIELKVEHELGEKKKEMPPYAVRRRCRQYADKFIDIQRKEFKRLGVLGDWEHPYKTMLPEYESATATELANFVEKGNVVRSKKPIYWCCSCQTALAEAEVEYADHKSPSIYVRFPLTDGKLKTVFENADPSRAYVIIWTTTPWTLPSNMAVALHPEFEYSLVEYEGSQYVLATELVESVAKACGWDMDGVKTVGTATGQQLELVKARHPFYDRESPLILGGHVTLDAGTGCVHTAPGHGREDYEVCLQYGIDIYSPLNDRGEYLDSVEFFAGLQVQKANPNVIEKVKEVGNLMGQADITHSYPHCWRCKKPVIFRATTQWFVSMEANELRQKALKAIRNDVEWIPSWGEERIYNMIEQRPDWCISRQRLWGVPILALLCEDCGEAWNDPEWMRDIAARFAKHPTGCDYWYEADMKDIVPEGLKCPKCGGRLLKRTGKSKKTNKQYTYYCCEHLNSKDEARKCDFMTWDVPVKDNCPECGWTMFKKSGRGFKKPFCIHEGCPNFTPEEKRGGWKRKTADDAGEAGSESGTAPEEKQPEAKKTAAKKTTAKKTAAKKTAASKTGAKKTASKTAAEKTAAKKTTAKKTAAKKTAAKKTAAKKAEGESPVGEA